MNSSPDPWEMARHAANVAGADISRTRKWMGATLDDVAHDVAIDTPKLSRICSGQAIPTVEEAQRLSDWLLQHRQSVVPTQIAAGHQTAHARMGDPASSEATVRSIAADKPLRQAIIDYASRPDVPWFTDTMLTGYLHDQGYRNDRNVIARARSLIEQEGLVVRLPTPAPASMHPRGIRLVRFTWWTKDPMKPNGDSECPYCTGEDCHQCTPVSWDRSTWCYHDVTERHEGTECLDPDE